MLNKEIQCFYYFGDVPNILAPEIFRKLKKSFAANMLICHTQGKLKKASHTQCKHLK